MKKLFVLAVMLLTASAGFCVNVVRITTSCGKVAYIDTDRTTLENTVKQVLAIEEALCGD